MVKKMSVDRKIIKELEKYHKINKYLMEQDITVPGEDLPADPTAGGDPMADVSADPLSNAEAPAPAEPIGDIPAEPISMGGEMETADTGEMGGTEELEITDLVNSQKNIEKKQEEYFDTLFKQLDNLQSKLGSMDAVVQRLNNIEDKIEKYREKTPQERLELRTLDSGPFHQKLSDFFSDKQGEMEKSGKNEYILTSDEVENFTDSDIKGTFDDYGPENE
jgi:hypothetical protein